jgi:hypothetical protein
MKNYIGCKIIKAKKVTLKEYFIKKYGKEFQYNGQQDLNSMVYLVIYPPIGIDDNKPYISMSPVSVFEKAYREIDNDEIKLMLENID